MDARPAIANVSAGRGFLAAMRTVHAHMAPARKRRLWLVLLLSILGGVAELVTIGALVPFLALLAAQGSPDRLLIATSLFIAAAIVAGLVRLLLAWASQSFIQRLAHDLSTEIQERILHQPYEYHLAHNSSEVVASLELVEQLTFGLIQPLLLAAASFVIGLFVVAAIAAIDVRTAVLAAVAFAVIYGVIVALFRRRLHSRSEVIGAAYGTRIRIVQESAGGIRDVILDEAQSAHVDAFRQADERLTRARIETVLASTAPRYLVESAGLVLLALLALAISRSGGGLPAALPVIGALALGAQRLLPLANQLYQGWSLAAANRAIAARVVGLLNLPVRLDERSADSQPLTVSIDFGNVSLRYPGRGQPALENISIRIPRGRRVAITGPTGSGKSSLADLLMGLLVPTAGEILIDGAPVDPPAWRRSVAHVPQSIFLIDASIARNIALSLPAEAYDPARAIAAAEAAQLGSFLDTLPDGIDTVVGERGVRLSGGQRQRIGIARALYKQTPVLILDEATSALDNATEAAVLEKIMGSHPDLTIILIAHRHSTIERCDLVLRLDHGRLVEVIDR
ncbi:MAG TPA: ABC transporter ATP-binding protein [Sphingomicrobium sp.]